MHKCGKHPDTLRLVVSFTLTVMKGSQNHMARWPMYCAPLLCHIHLFVVANAQVDPHLNAFVERLRNRTATPPPPSPVSSSEDSCGTTGAAPPLIVPATPSTASTNTIHLVCDGRRPAMPEGASAAQGAGATVVPGHTHRRTLDIGLPPQQTPRKTDMRMHTPAFIASAGFVRPCVVAAELCIASV